MNFVACCFCCGDDSRWTSKSISLCSRIAHRMMGTREHVQSISHSMVATYCLVVVMAMPSRQMNERTNARKDKWFCSNSFEFGEHKRTAECQPVPTESMSVWTVECGRSTFHAWKFGQFAYYFSQQNFYGTWRRAGAIIHSHSRTHK